MAPRSLDTEEQHYAIKSWRYLRGAMVALVAGLFVSVVYERGSVDCWKTSISAYYYTPVHNYFVAALLGIGVCLFCLRGSHHVEDGLLNLAGMCAPVVALVPTTGPGTCGASFARSLEDRGADIENNITALIAVGVLAGFVLVLLTALDRLKPPRSTVNMFAVAAAVWIALMLVFWLDPDLFARGAHYTAAIAMFGCILVVVIVNAIGYKKKKQAVEGPEVRLLVNPYWAIGGAMLGCSAIAALLAFVVDWPYTVIAIEFALIFLFAIFWIIQTVELWDDGLRPVPPK